jgi:hypothetical protein
VKTVIDLPPVNVAELNDTIQRILNLNVDHFEHQDELQATDLVPRFRNHIPVLRREHLKCVDEVLAWVENAAPGILYDQANPTITGGVVICLNALLCHHAAYGANTGPILRLPTINNQQI